jgi:hypothetical protein
MRSRKAQGAFRALPCRPAQGDRVLPSDPMAREILERRRSTPPVLPSPRLALGRIRSISTCILRLRIRAWIRGTRTEPTEAPACGEAITRSQPPLLGLGSRVQQRNKV